MGNPLRYRDLLIIGLLSIFLIDACKTKPSKKVRTPEVTHLEDSILTKRIQGIQHRETLIYNKIRNLNLDDNDSIISLIDTINYYFIGGNIEDPYFPNDALFHHILDSLFQQSDDKNKARQIVLFPLLRKIFVENLNREQHSVIYSTDGSTLYCKVDDNYREDLIQKLVENKQCYLLRFKKILLHSSGYQDKEHLLNPPEDSEPGYILHSL